MVFLLKKIAIKKGHNCARNHGRGNKLEPLPTQFHVYLANNARKEQTTFHVPRGLTEGTHHVKICLFSELTK